MIDDLLVAQCSRDVVYAKPLAEETLGRRLNDAEVVLLAVAIVRWRVTDLANFLGFDLPK